MSRGRLILLFGNLVLVVATGFALKAWPRFETGLALLVELATFAVLFSIFWKGRSRGSLLAELSKLVDKRHADVMDKLPPAELGKQLLDELTAGPFAPEALAPLRERIAAKEWQRLADEWPALSSQLFATRTKPEAVREAALLLAYASRGVERLAAASVNA